MFDDLIELALAEDPMLDELEREDVAELYVRAVEMRDIAANAVRKLGEHIGTRFDTPVTLANGWVVKPQPWAKKRTGWNKPALWEQVWSRARWLIDPESGERVQALAKPTVDQFCDVNTTRTRVWKQAGVDLDEYCTLTPAPTVEIVK